MSFLIHTLLLLSTRSCFIKAVEYHESDFIWKVGKRPVNPWEVESMLNKMEAASKKKVRKDNLLDNIERCFNIFGLVPMAHANDAEKEKMKNEIQTRYRSINILIHSDKYKGDSKKKAEEMLRFLIGCNGILKDFLRTRVHHPYNGEGVDSNGFAGHANQYNGEGVDSNGFAGHANQYKGDNQDSNGFARPANQFNSDIKQNTYPEAEDRAKDRARKAQQKEFKEKVEQAGQAWNQAKPYAEPIGPFVLPGLLILMVVLIFQFVHRKCSAHAQLD